MDKRVTWFETPRDADDAVKKHYQAMTPQQRLDELTALIERWGHWIRIGVPPQMVDILNFAGSIPFEDVFSRTIEGRLLGVAVRFPSRADLADMKRASGRPQDLADLEHLG